MLDWRISVPVFWPIWCRETGATEMYTTRCRDLCFSVLAAFPSGHCPDLSSCSGVVTWSRATWWIIAGVNHWEVVPGWLEVSVDERSGVLIGLISWRSHHSGMICRWNVWRKESGLHHFLISKVARVGYLFFRLMFSLFSSDLPPKHQRRRRWNGRWAPWARPPTTRALQTTPPTPRALQDE